MNRGHLVNQKGLNTDVYVDKKGQMKDKIKIRGLFCVLMHCIDVT
jgi:hypothetical protein